MSRKTSRACSAASTPARGLFPRVFQVQPRFLPLPVDIVFEKDVAVTLRDGVTIYVDILRPPGAEKVPVVVAWSPYGKSRGNAPRYTDLFGLLGMDTSTLSGLMKFEGPDPAFWCAHGYAVCNPDPRGCFNSEGDIRFGTGRRARTTTISSNGLAFRTGATARSGPPATPTLPFPNGSPPPSNRRISRPSRHGKA